MAESDRPQITLISPPTFDLAVFPDRLARLMDVVDVACLRISLASREEDNLTRASDALREVAHARDVAVVLDTHLLLVERLGLDGVHLTDGARSVRAARKALGADAIIGTFCGGTRHEGIGAAEAGADYVAFGPLGATPLGDGQHADHALFAWWSEMIEIPVIAEGALSVDLIRDFAPVTDFFAIGPEIWATEDPVTTLKALLAPLA